MYSPTVVSASLLLVKYVTIVFKSIFQIANCLEIPFSPGHLLLLLQVLHLHARPHRAIKFQHSKIKQHSGFGLPFVSSGGIEFNIEFVAEGANLHNELFPKRTNPSWIGKG